jgi:outer membrane lipoprotein carrier protein
MARVKYWPQPLVAMNSWRLGVRAARILVLASLAVHTTGQAAAPAPATTAAAPIATALDRYLEGMTTWSAQFQQTVSDARGRRVGEGSGRFLVVRPGRFRWESTPAGASGAAQLLVADGRNLWFYDRDLEQATVRPLQQALPQSPAMLLAGGAGLNEAFDVRADGRHDDLEWVKALPRDRASDFREARFGFRDRELVRLEIVDKLGQRSTLQFTVVQRNQVVDPAEVRFQLPPGVDLIGTPLPP